MTLNDMINTTYSTIKKYKKQAVLTGLAGLMAVTLASCDPNDPNKPTIDTDSTTDYEQVDDSQDYDNTVDDATDETPDEDAIETDDNKVDDDNTLEEIFINTEIPENSVYKLNITAETDSSKPVYFTHDGEKLIPTEKITIDGKILNYVQFKNGEYCVGLENSNAEEDCANINETYEIPEFNREDSGMTNDSTGALFGGNLDKLVDESNGNKTLYRINKHNIPHTLIISQKTGVFRTQEELEDKDLGLNYEVDLGLCENNNACENEDYECINTLENCDKLMYKGTIN